MTTYTRILYQIVFGSKRRLRFFTEDNQNALFNYVAGIAKNKKCYSYKIGGDSNHLHLLVDLYKMQNLAGFVQEIKKGSNAWLRENRSTYPDFQGWQDGYSAFTYEMSALKVLKEYIENQNEHHRIVTFREEYIKLLKEHGIEFDEKYLFD